MFFHITSCHLQIHLQRKNQAHHPKSDDIMKLIKFALYAIPRRQYYCLNMEDIFQLVQPAL